MKKTKQVVVGLGEIGLPLMKLFSKKSLVVGYDINPKLMNKKNSEKFSSLKTSFLHICIPFTKNFIKHVQSLNTKFNPEAIVIGFLFLEILFTALGMAAA